jgi:hypothetical protein
MNFDLSCYGARRSTASRTWSATSTCARRPRSTPGTASSGRPWPRLLGFSPAARRDARPRASSPVAALQQAGLEAYARDRCATRSKQPESQARTQSPCSSSSVAAGRERGELWRVSVDPTTLPTGACYEDGRAGPARVLPGHRARLLRRRLGGPAAPGRERLRLADAPRAAPRHVPVGLQLAPRRRRPRARWVLGVGAARGRAASSSPPASWSPRPTCARTPARSPPSSITSTRTRSPARATARVPAGPREAGRCIAAAASLYVHQGSLHVAASTARAAGSPATCLQPHPAPLRVLLRDPPRDLRDLSTLPADVQRLRPSSADPCLRIEGYSHECRAQGVCRIVCEETTLACPQTLGVSMKCGVGVCESAS